MIDYPYVIGFTGSIGRGCTETCNLIMERMPQECIKISLSDILIEKICETKKLKAKYNELKKLGMQELRNFLQEQGNKIREKYEPSKLADLAIDKIKKMKEEGKLSEKNFIIIDSIRNIAEIEVLRRNFKTYIFAIYEDEEIRWKRLMMKYNKDYGAFLRDDKRDHEEKKKNGQQVDACVDCSDILIRNNMDIKNSEYDKSVYFDEKVNYYLQLIKQPMRTYPRIEETYMNMAYSMAAMSKCMQRKVGALITTEDMEIVSLGYNDVPVNSQECKAKFKECYRKKRKKEILNQFNYCPICKKKLTYNKYCSKCNKSIDKDIFVDKDLDLCRSLHAEENAIVKAAKAGISLKNGTIYTTTFPCNLCANKIRNVGLKKVIFVEPYPSKDTIEILTTSSKIEKAVEIELFEGVKSRAFFDLYKRIGEMEID